MDFLIIWRTIPSYRKEVITSWAYENTSYYKIVKFNRNKWTATAQNIVSHLFISSVLKIENNPKYPNQILSFGTSTNWTIQIMKHKLFWISLIVSLKYLANISQYITEDFVWIEAKPDLRNIKLFKKISAGQYREDRILQTKNLFFIFPNIRIDSRTALLNFIQVQDDFPPHVL